MLQVLHVHPICIYCISLFVRVWEVLNIVCGVLCGMISIDSRNFAQAVMVSRYPVWSPLTAPRLGIGELVLYCDCSRYLRTL